MSNQTGVSSRLELESFSPSMRPYVQQIRAKARAQSHRARKLQERSAPKFRFGTFGRDEA